MAEKLTPQQQKAVTDRGGNLLISAAAGSGKTKVLVDRLMQYILDSNVPANIDDFLIITYTKAAAAELRGKIAAKLSALVAANPGNRHLQQQMQRLYLAKISTVHGFCTDILRQYAYKLDIAADFRVADENECLQLQLAAVEQTLEAAYEHAQEDADFQAFIESQGLGRDDRQIPEIILQVYASARCHLHPQRWLQWCAQNGAEKYTDAAQTPWGAYLLNDLKAYLAWQIDAMQRCADAAAAFDGMEKPAQLFADTVAQLRLLHQSNTWDAVVKNKHISYGTLSFSKGCKDTDLAERMKAVRNACKDGLSKRLRSFSDHSESVLTDMDALAGAARGLVALVQAFEANYGKLKKRRAILDFSDLEHYTLDLLLGKQRSAATSLAAEIGERFCEVMVDEYQDSNAIQDAIFSALTEKRRNCFMVGDVKQSIYRFRLADPGIFIEKYNSYASADVAEPGEGRKVLLNHNFRSSCGVISAVNAVFAQCMSVRVGDLNYTEEEMLREGIPHIPLREQEVSLCAIEVQSDTYAEEAAFTAQRIAQLLDGTHYIRNGDVLRPVMPEDIVILLRSPGSVGSEYQYALEQRGIRCFAGDQGDMFQTEEISTLRALLSVIDNPLQDIPLAAVLTSPVFGFTADDLARLRSRDRKSNLYTLLTTSHEDKNRNFTQRLTELRTRARHLTVTELLACIYTETGLLSVYSAMGSGGEKLNNLQTFFKIASDFEAAGPKTLNHFLEYLNTIAQRGLAGTAAQPGRGTVTIMSIHKSKGLEFPIVFLCGLSRAFNQESSRGQVLCDKDLGIGLSCVDKALRVRYPGLAKRAISVKMLHESISEELRVLYVAMTRARDRLIMTYADKHLAKALTDIVSRLDMSDPRMLAAEAGCPGDWVLQTALTRTEAGAFFAVAGHPVCVSVQESPWDISITAAETSAIQTAEEETEKAQIPVDRLLDTLTFVYGHTTATQVPSKLTATQLKGRQMDTEIAEGTQTNRLLTFRKPGKTNLLTSTAYGTAMHAALQYLRFDCCDTAEHIRFEVDRLVSEGMISAEQAAMIDCDRLLAFFATELGQKIVTGSHVLREFKFSILTDAEKYFPDIAADQILLQGVVDCAVIEDDGITIIDFKTDNVTEMNLQTTVDKYSAQVCAYADAMSAIYGLPIKTALLYFFAINRFVKIQ